MPVKNIGLQIKAMVEIVKKYPHTELWVVGDGSERQSLEHQIKKYGLDKNIKLIGWQKDLNEYYSKANVFLLTSNSEGWGIVIIEAAGFGLPIIMTDVGCANEVIKNNENGIVIPVGDKNVLVKEMLKMVEDKELNQRLGQEAKKSIKNLPSREETLELYKKIWELAKYN